MLDNRAVADRIVELARDLGVLRVRDLRERGIHPEYLRRLCHRGVLTRTGWGLYVLAGAPYSEHLSLAEAAKRVPDGIVCLLSALQVHRHLRERQVFVLDQGDKRESFLGQLVHRVGDLLERSLGAAVPVRCPTSRDGAAS